MSGSCTPDEGMDVGSSEIDDVIKEFNEVIGEACNSDNTYSYTDPDPSSVSSKEQKQEEPSGDRELPRDRLPSNQDRLPSNRDRLPSNRDRLPSNTKEPTATMMSREMRADLAARNDSLGRDDSVEFSLVDADRDIFR